MNWLYRFMYGRHGPDQLTFFILIVSMAIQFCSAVFRLPLLSLLSTLLLAVCVWRIFSKNNEKRSRENAFFMRFWGKVPAFFRSLSTALREGKTHRFFKCPGCGARLRVPRGKGKIMITCPNCKKELVKKT